eukprot:CAMPEP_0180241750 /NCGR_PEP_ID=MMETSP0987-20121128/32843_1 /TAXON_ID=697907 /ORGANISM="non described non described, Strain CCMP2293" /LENGTH=138 /DNA_ID=CAMNT_0022208791 /DNA_START=24 /DNA_END=436 /DNA_ORIENTATION=+
MIDRGTCVRAAALLSALFASCEGQSGEHSCSWQYNDLHWDLSPLVKHKPSRDYKVDRSNWEFDMNVCANTLRIPPACTHQFGDKVQRAPGYQTFTHDGEIACYYMGNVNTRGLLDEGRPEEGLKLTYKAGTSCDGRTG